LEETKNDICFELYFHRAIRKYGKENFKWKVIEKCNEGLGERETYYIDKFNSKSPNGYNMTDGNDNTTLGFKFSDEQRQTLSKRMKGKGNPNYGGGDWMIGDNNPAKKKTVRKKISEAKKGMRRPDVVKARAKTYIMTDLSTGEETEIYNMLKWTRENNFTYEGVKQVLRNNWKQYKGFHFRRKEL
jgi:group I intron endonuclease